METQTPYDHGPTPDRPRDPALAAAVRALLRPDTTPDALLTVADALDEAAPTLTTPTQTTAYRAAARLLRDAAPYYAPPPAGGPPR